MELIKIKKKKKAIIISIKGLKLTRNEKLLISNEKPWGIILFKRNIKSLGQIKELTKNIKKITKDKFFPILIDEEGSSVTRLGNLINNNMSANYFGNMYSINKKIGLNLYKEYLNSICKNLKNIGININTIPVLDLLRRDTSKVIGNRSFSNKKKIIKILGQITVKQCNKNKIISVIKHIPGHGCAIFDSHFKMPKVNWSKNELNKNYQRNNKKKNRI